MRKRKNGKQIARQVDHRIEQEQQGDLYRLVAEDDNATMIDPRSASRSHEKARQVD